MRYRLRDDSCGFRIEEGEPVDLRRQPLRPWAITTEGDVVYADWKQQGFGLEGILQLAHAGMQKRTRLMAYDKIVSQQRRRLFDSALAQDAAAHPECSAVAVQLVSNNLIAFVEAGLRTVADGPNKLGGVIKQRCFSNTGSGRLGTVEDGANCSDDTAWQRALEELRSGRDVAKVLGIQSALANVLTKKGFALDADKRVIFDATASRVSPSEGHLHSWFKPGLTPVDQQEDGLRRGRTKAGGGGAAASSSLPGITKPGDMAGGVDAESRLRGVDGWAPLAGSGFVKGIDQRNLVFGAGRSGTTGELLKAYRTFGRADSDELFKQYLFAIVAYLVGGGHHTCHEIFSVANLLVGANGPRGGGPAASVSDLARDAYVPGKYIRHLPDSYLTSPHFNTLKEKYYDIAMLGHLHGTFV